MFLKNTSGGYFCHLIEDDKQMFGSALLMLSGADDHSIQEFSSLIIDLNSHTPMVTNFFVQKFVAVGADLSMTAFA